MNYRNSYTQGLRKRERRPNKLQTEPVDLVFSSILEPYSEDAIELIIEKILKNNVKGNKKCELTLQEKQVIIYYISNKVGVSFNCNRFMQLMNVWRYFGVKFLQMQNYQLKIGQNLNNNNLIQQCLFTNFFVLYGQVSIYENQGYSTQYVTFSTESELEEIVQGHEPKLIIKQNKGFGQIFTKKSQNIFNGIVRVANAIIVELDKPKLQAPLVNFGGMDEEKKIKIVQGFPIFCGISKKLASFVNDIQLKKYTKNQYIYKRNTQPKAIYLILKGEVMFQSTIQLQTQKQHLNMHKKKQIEYIYQTQILGIKNYFGEQQILQKQNRYLNAICKSIQCILLQIPIDKFQKLLLYNSDFYQQIKLCMMFKNQQRKSKINKSIQIYSKYKNNNNNQNYQYKIIQKQIKQESESKNKNGKKYKQPVKIMHGNVIKSLSKRKQESPVNFSMLNVHPDIYKATLQKYRKYSMPSPKKYKPEVNWDLKRVWKVLNLQNILRDQSTMRCPKQGLQFYQSHLRLQNHVIQNRSLRPKTCSSNHKTKLQYIAYLQQFNN